MKKIYYLLLLLMLLIPNKVFASGGFNVSTSSVTMYVGESKTITISASNSAGRLDISSLNSGVAGISTSSIFLDNDSSDIIISGSSVGSTTILVKASSNYATYDEEILGGQTATIIVNVIAKPSPQPDSTPTPTPTPNNNNNTNKSLSTNNNLKELSVTGYELIKVDNNNYTLEVNNNITNIEIKAEAADTKAKVSGTGNHELNVGENNVEVVITSESGVENKINIKVTRKDAFYLDDLDLALKDTKNDNIQISLKEETKISSEDLNKIKNSKKTVSFNYYDESKKIIYSWNIDGSQIENIIEFNTEVLFDTNNKDKIFKLANYADGQYLSFQHEGDLPNGTKIKIFVGDKFKNSDIVNIYHYKKGSEELENIVDGLKVENGYIEFSIEHCSDYFVTMSNVNLETKKESSINIFLIISIVELIIIFVGILLFVLRVVPKLTAKKESNIDDSTYFQDNKTKNK